MNLYVQLEAHRSHLQRGKTQNLIRSFVQLSIQKVGSNWSCYFCNWSWGYIYGFIHHIHFHVSGPFPLTSISVGVFFLVIYSKLCKYSTVLMAQESVTQEGTWRITLVHVFSSLLSLNINIHMSLMIIMNHFSLRSSPFLPVHAISEGSQNSQKAG